jgi:hypothetical protein
MSNVGIVAPRGNLSLVRMPRWPGQPSTLEIVRHGLPKRGLPEGVAAWRMRNLPNLWRGLWRVKLAALASKITHCPSAYGVLYLDILHADGSRTPLGLASMRVVTDAGVGYLVDALQNLVEPENLKFHGFGTGTTAEAASQTALVTEETTQYATDNTRPTGSQTETSANIYRTVATYSPDSGATRAITEHGIFSQAATGGGVMLDRSVFSAVNLVASADSLQATYDFTINSGG